MPDRALTPPEVAKRLGIDPAKIRGWISRGELRAINLASRPGGRPLWRVLPADLEAFLSRRAATPPPPARRRRRRQPGDVIEFY